MYQRPFEPVENLVFTVRHSDWRQLYGDIPQLPRTSKNFGCSEVLLLTCHAMEKAVMGVAASIYLFCNCCPFLAKPADLPVSEDGGVAPTFGQDFSCPEKVHATLEPKRTSSRFYILRVRGRRDQEFCARVKARNNVIGGARLGRPWFGRLNTDAHLASR